jgi:hypothetical protein
VTHQYFSENLTALPCNGCLGVVEGNCGQVNLRAPIRRVSAVGAAENAEVIGEFTASVVIAEIIVRYRDHTVSPPLIFDIIRKKAFFRTIDFSLISKAASHSIGDWLW